MSVTFITTHKNTLHQNIIKTRHITDITLLDDDYDGNASGGLIEDQTGKKRLNVYVLRNINITIKQANCQFNHETIIMK